MTTPISPLRMGAREWALLLMLSALWGGSFFFFKVLVAEVPPFTVVLGRVGIAAVALNAYLLLRRDHMPWDAGIWRGFLMLGLLNNVIPFSLIVFGETRISSGLASILNAMTPVFTVLAAHALTSKEKLNGTKAAGVLCGLGGVAVLVGPAAFGQSGGADLVGEACCLLAALSYAFAGIFGRRFRGIPPIKVATGQITASTLILIPLSLLVDRPWTLAAPSPHAWAAFFSIALLCTALAYLIYFRILATAGATNISLVTFLLPVSALILGALVLHERITAGALIGMGLIGVGLAAIDGRLPAAIWRKVRKAIVGRILSPSSRVGGV
ncbi:MAG TPA: DMT family transporter [Acetobacteraceae bacterium]|nr:DMT family transporter [Acetobacteraceae bacterium]